MSRTDSAPARGENGASRPARSFATGAAYRRRSLFNSQPGWPRRKPRSARPNCSTCKSRSSRRRPWSIVLEDGEQMEGCIEWYDRNTLKMRGRSKTLVYKSAIKYMYKLGDAGQ